MLLIIKWDTGGHSRGVGLGVRYFMQYIMNLNKYVIINNKEKYYDNIFNYLYSKKMNTNESGRFDWTKVIYPPKLFKKDDSKQIKDKRKQNFRLVAEKHVLSDDNILHIRKII